MALAGRATAGVAGTTPDVGANGASNTMGHGFNYSIATLRGRLTKVSNSRTFQGPASGSMSWMPHAVSARGFCFARRKPPPKRTSADEEDGMFFPPP